MSDVNANIRIGVDSTQAISSLKSLQGQISAFNKSIIASNSQAMAAQSSALAGLTAQIGATKQFSTSMVNVESSVSRLGNAIDKNKLSMGEYFRYGTASTKSFGRMFGKEHTQIMELASDRVKRLQTQYIALSSAQNGMTKTMAVRPLNLFNADAAIAVQRQQLFNKLLNDGSTRVINFGKNTQWAGRQLMVGFTVPLTIFGGLAGKIFMDLEKQIVNFRRVYGDAMTPAGETDQMIEQVKGLGKEFTKYGIAVKDTVGLASDIAAAGAQGDDLVAATAESTRLATLGMIEMNQAMTATMALQTAFRLSNEELTQSVDFLNAVENQTVLSLDDITVAIPKVAPIIKGLGGDVQDLAIFLTAMREGGVNAAEGANALKSGLASLINPTKNAKEQLEKVGINISSILSQNKGDIRAIVTEFGSALGELGKFERQQTLAKVFGKYQFARLGALFENISRDGSQAQRVVDLTGQSFEELAALSEKELGAIEDSIGVKFTGAIERLKLAIAPIGEVFLRIATPVIDLATKILDKFNELSPGVKQFISVIVAGVGVVAPAVIMLVGLFGNFIGQAIKGFAMFNNFFNRLRGGGKDLGYMANEQLDAAAAATTLEGRTESLTAALNVQRSAVAQLARAYGGYVTAAGAAASGLPQAFRGRPAKGMATGGLVPGNGNKDTVPAMLTPGESVITKEATQKFGPLLQAMNNGSIPGFKEGVINLGGEQFTLDFSSTQGDKSSILSIERMFDNISIDAVEARDAFKQIIRDISQQQIQNQESMQFTATQFKDIASRSQIEEISSLGIERRYNASSAGERRSIPLQMQEDLGVSPEIAEREYRRAQGAADAASTEIARYYDEQLSALDIDDVRRQGLQEKRDKSVSSAMQVDRAHMVALTNQQKTEREAWNARMWTPQSGVENQLSNMLVTSQSNQDVYRQYLNELNNDVASEQQKATILRKITSNLALTESELQIQKVVLQGILADSAALAKTSDMFPTYARATSSAADYRARTPSEIGEDVYATSYESGQSALRGVSDGSETASNSRATIRTGEFVAGGLEEGIKRGTPDAVKEAENLRNKVDNAISKPRRGSSRPQGPVGVSTSTLVAQMAEERITQGQARRGSRGRATREGTISPLALRSGEESSRVMNIANAQDMARTEEINRAHNQAIIENTERNKAVSTELAKQPSRAKRFGGALANGSAKLTGAMFAMDGVVFAASMMNNSMGEFAQKIMPAVFAVQGIAMTLPMVSGGMKALAGALGMTVPALLAFIGPIALAGLAFGGVALLAKLQADKQNEAIKANQKYIDATLGGAASMTNFAKATNKQTILQAESSLRVGELGVKEKQKGFAEEFVVNESGAEILESLKLIAEAPERVASLRAQLIQAMAAGFLSPKQAKAVARQVSIELGDPVLGQSVVNSIDEALTKNGKKLKGSLSAAFAGTIEDTASPQIQMLTELLEKTKSAIPSLSAEQASAFERTLGPNAGAAMGTGIAPGFGTAAPSFKAPVKSVFEPITKEQGAANFQVLATNATKLREAIALLNIEQARGTITQKDYDARSKLLSDRFNEQTLVISQLKNVLGDGENAVGGFFLNYATTMGMTEDQFKSVESTIENITKGLKDVPETLSTELKLSVVTGGMSVEDLTNLDALFNLSDGKGEKNKAEFELLIKNTGDSTPEQVTQFYLLIAGFEDEIKKTVIARFQSNGVVDAENYLLALNSINSLPPKLRNILEPVISGVGIEGLKTLKFYLDSLNDIPEKQTKEYLILIKEIVTRQDARDLSGLVEENRFGVKVGADKALAAAQAEIDAILAGSTTGGGGGGGNGDENGGGSAAKSFLEQLIADTEADLALAPKMINKLKGMGIPEQIIEMIGGGEEGLKKAQELLRASKDKLKKLIEDFNKKTINEVIKSTQDATKEAKQKNAATDILISQGMSREDATSVASDAGTALEIITASGDKSGKSIRRLVNAFKELKAVPEFVDPIKNKLEEINNIYKAQMLPLQQKIDKQQEIVDGIQEEIDAIQNLNDSDQNRIRDLERQKEMIQRQIDEYEALNDMDQRRIDTLQRQDELRNRESDAISHELDVLSDMETKIKDAYQERIDALTKVSKLNDDILQKEKDQLGVSQALAEGDIYAATAAAQQMRQNQIKSAQELSMEALGEARDNSVTGLTTSGGLTRDQAEERIRQIKEQSYQTSLLVRDIEDQIFNRNQLMIPLKNQQLVIDIQIRDISDIVYGRESQILKIQTDKLSPQAQILKNYNDEALALKKQLDTQAGILDGAELLNSMTDEQITAAGVLGSQWYEVAKQIKNAQDLASKARTDLGDEPSKEAQKYIDKPKKYKEDLEEYRRKLNKINTEEKALTDIALASGKDAMNKNMGGKIMKYANGSIVGAGSRDSIPAMLTPGEYVIRKAMVDKYGTPMFEKINQGSFSMPSFNTGEQTPTDVSGNSGGNTNVVAPMYNNYSVNVSVSNSGASADEIANKTLMKIKQLQSTQIRSGRGF